MSRKSNDPMSFAWRSTAILIWNVYVTLVKQKMNYCSLYTNPGSLILRLYKEYY